MLGAIAFMFNDVLIVHIGNLNLIAVAAWLPLILALYARGLSERRVSWIIGSGVVFAIALLAGHAQMTAITLIGLMAVAVWQIIVAQGGRGRVIGLALLTPLIALGLSAAQLLPSLEMTRYSLRAGLSYEEATAYSLPPAALASTFSPLLFGRGAAEFWGPWERVETMYVGVVPLLLAGLAFRRKWRDTSWFFLALGVLGLLIALGQVHADLFAGAFVAGAGRIACARAFHPADEFLSRGSGGDWPAALHDRIVFTQACAGVGRCGDDRRCAGVDRWLINPPARSIAATIWRRLSPSCSSRRLRLAFWCCALNPQSAISNPQSCSSACCRSN